MDLQELVRLVESGQHGVAFDMRLHEEELARFADDKAGGMAHDVSVDISPQTVSVKAKTKLAALTMDVQIVGTPLLEDGHVRFSMDSLNINKRPAPDFMRAQISNAINEKLDPNQLPVKLTRLELGEGWVQVTGETR